MATEPHYLSARRRNAVQGGDNIGRDECVCCDAQGRAHAAFPLPARGHSFAIDTVHHRAVVFGRQPGFFAYAFPLDGSSLSPPEPQPLPLPEGHHFYGHGVYSLDGQTLYATENDYVNARGVIGVYDTRPGRGYARIGEFDSGGIGPHDIVLIPDGETLCVANGGLQTHPDFGKTILNAATMVSSLAYLNRQSGQILETHTLEYTLPAAWRHLSLRHLALDAQGHVWAGCQYVNPDGARPALVWHHVRGQDLQPATCPLEVQRAMRNYVGSVAVNQCGNIVAASSPVGGQVLFWETTSATWMDVVTLPDVCGIAPSDGDGFLLSSGHGALVTYDPKHHTQTMRPVASTLAWDNHIRRV